MSRDNGVGLSTDMDLLEVAWGTAGHDVARVNWQDHTMRGCDVAVFLELFQPALMPYCRAAVGVFNLEWFPLSWRRHLPAFTQLWAKGRACQEQLRAWGYRSALTGWLGRDLRAPGTRECKVLHHKGKSGLKGTAEVIEAWRRHGDTLPPLTIISHQPIPDPPAGVSVHGHLPHDALVEAMNSHAIHLCPSRAEGWGHYIAEALSVEAVTITTDHSPMNEHVEPGWGFVLPARFGPPHNSVRQMIVDPDNVAEVVRRAARLSPGRRALMGRAARAHWAARNAYFRKVSAELLDRMEP